MRQESEETTWPSAYPQMDTPEYYPTTWPPRHNPYYLQTSHFTKVWEQPIPLLSASMGIGAPKTTYDDGAINKTWHDEWEAEPRPFGSTRPMNLLTKPADINLRTHPQDAKRVYLNHWDRQHEPDGAAAQRLVLQKRQDEMGKRILARKAERQEERRKRVRQAAEVAGVIDLTTDGMPRRNFLWKYRSDGDRQLSASTEVSIQDWSHTWQL